MAHPGGHITSNKAEALARFLANKQAKGEIAIMLSVRRGKCSRASIHAPRLQRKQRKQLSSVAISCGILWEADLPGLVLLRVLNGAPNAAAIDALLTMMPHFRSDDDL